MFRTTARRREILRSCSGPETPGVLRRAYVKDENPTIEFSVAGESMSHKFWLKIVFCSPSPSPAETKFRRGAKRVNCQMLKFCIWCRHQSISFRTLTSIPELQTPTTNYFKCVARKNLCGVTSGARFLISDHLFDVVNFVFIAACNRTRNQVHGDQCQIQHKRGRGFLHVSARYQIQNGQEVGEIFYFVPFDWQWKNALQCWLVCDL